MFVHVSACCVSLLREVIRIYRMRIVNLLYPCFVILGISACASSPPKSPAFHKAAAPGPLVCPGRVSNAPLVANNGRIKNFSPVAYIAGARVHRAPVSACVSSGYGPRNFGAGRFHYGVDYYTGAPAPVIAGGDGVVEAVKSMRGYGRTVLIRHNDRVLTRYAHLSRYANGVKPGARVRAGDVIAFTGDTGNASAVHLHYEVIVDGQKKNPLAVGS